MDKDIFSILIEKELQSDNPCEEVIKFGKYYLENLSYIGKQLEDILLGCSCSIIDEPTLKLYPKWYIDKATRGIEIMNIVEREMKASNQKKENNINHKKVNYKEIYKDERCPICKSKLIFNDDNSDCNCEKENCSFNNPFEGKIVASAKSNEELYQI